MTSTAQQLFEQGKIEGEIEGETLFLEHLLHAKLGPLPSGYQRRIAQATPESRLTWGERALTAATLADVFADTD
ncbi:MAG: hypothetical protein JNM60_09470 [Candidatus Competibacteraceae bacterium]|nr:hypothetical protein [Candidatus Competibacteraceae bacterium]